MAKTNWFSKKKDNEDSQMESPSKKRKVQPEASLGEEGVQVEARGGGGGVHTLTGSKSNIVNDEASLGEVESEASMGGEGVNAPTGSKSNNVRSKPGYCKMSSKAQADKKKQKSIQAG